jgi:hypothetical protein
VRFFLGFFSRRESGVVQMLRSFGYVSAVLVSLMVAACQQGRVEPKKYPVSGTVTVDGNPLNEDGLIYFKTIATGSLDAIEIKGGKYSGAAEPGERRVEIVAYRTKMADIDGMKGEIKESLIPARYNLESTLTATVTPDGPNRFQFELTTK